jgi:hypothetical protein
METKEIKINVPEGYEIDKENSTFDCIKFKPNSKKWISNPNKRIKGYEIEKGKILEFTDISPLCMEGRDNCKDIFATEKQAKSALAMAQISQIMANDERFGGIIADEEWNGYCMNKYCLIRYDNKLSKDVLSHTHHFLAFHTEKQRDLFLEENEQLVKDYLMID